MISKLISIVARLALIWCWVVVAGCFAKLLWIGVMMGWEVM